MARQVFVHPQDIQGCWAWVRGQEARHLKRVLRVEAGKQLTLFDGLGKQFQGVVDEVGASDIKVRIENADARPTGRTSDLLPQNENPHSHVALTLIQAVPKQKGMEHIISQCTQVGIERVVPVLTERTQVRIDPDEPGHKMERWLRVATESAKQCGASRVPEVEVPVTWDNFLRRLEPYDLSLIATLEGTPHILRTVLESWRAAHNKTGKKINICLAVGPEGDFTPSEVEQAARHDFQPVIVKTHVLRTTTAATVLCALLHYALD